MPRDFSVDFLGQDMHAFIVIRNLEFNMTMQFLVFIENYHYTYVCYINILKHSNKGPRWRFRGRKRTSTALFCIGLARVSTDVLRLSPSVKLKKWVSPFAVQIRPWGLRQTVCPELQSPKRPDLYGLSTVFWCRTL